ncbi:MAG: DUF4423 domain-containing protein [Bdellovibrionota bacterium]
MNFIDTKNEEFRLLLQQEFAHRTAKNPNYSLRSFARYLDFDHSSLSGILSGKRAITHKTIQKLSPKLNLKPRVYMHLLSGLSFAEMTTDHQRLEESTFSYMSEWVYDAVLELTRVKGFKFSDETVAKKLGINIIYARSVIQTLLSLKLLCKEGKNYKLALKRTTNLSSNEHTSAALRKYQKSLLEKSILALDTVERSERDHTSSTFAINKEDLPKIKKIIQKFRYEISEFVQRKEEKMNDVYSLQVSFFPLTQIQKKEK